MMRSLYSGVSGLQNHQLMLDIIGNNIANVNTVGFKSSRASFAEMLAQTLQSASGPTNGFGGRNPMQVGLGLKLMSVDTQFQQGGLETTGNYTDLAIQGDGFFVVSDGNQRYFTRSGAFNIDADGYLTAQGGTLRVQGYMANQMGIIDNNLTPHDIQIPFNMKAPASATSEISLYCNLNAEATDSEASLVDAGTTGVTTVSGEAINGAGGTHVVTITGSNAVQGYGLGANTWSAGGLQLDDTLDNFVGIADFDNFEITVDGDTTYQITGLSGDTTVAQLIEAINSQTSGIIASLESGEIKLVRDYYGASTSITMSGDVYDEVFGGDAHWLDPTPGTGWVDGINSDLAAVDVFTPSNGGSSITTNLTIEADEATGLMTNIVGLGGGGVTIYAPPDSNDPLGGGLAAGTLQVDTEDTTHTTSIITYDSLGGQHVLDITFTKTATANTWLWEVNVEEPAQIINGNTGSVTFNDDGSLESFNFDDGSMSFSFDPNNGAESTISIDLNAGTVGGVDGITQFASPTTTIVQSQNGYGMGDLIDISIDANGAILGAFSNDQIITLAQIVLADFNNPQGLLKDGNNLYRLSANSGDPVFGQAQVNMGSSIYSGYVEMSNVDLSKEFAEMIIAQRGFQASARVITTSDYLLEEVVRLKR